MEPSYANVREEEGEEVHGLAFGMDKENAEKMTRYENTHIFHSKDFFLVVSLALRRATSLGWSLWRPTTEGS